MFVYKLLIGVVVSHEQVVTSIASLLEANRDVLVKERYKSLSPLLAKAKQIPELRWANGVDIKNELEKQVIAIIGPKDERDLVVKGGKVCRLTDSLLFTLNSERVVLILFDFFFLKKKIIYIEKRQGIHDK